MIFPSLPNLPTPPHLPIPYSLLIKPPNPAHPPHRIFSADQILRHVSENLAMCARPLAQIVVVLFNFNSDFQLYYRFFKIEHCRALVFTVVDFHLEATLPQIL